MRRRAADGGDDRDRQETRGAIGARSRRASASGRMRNSASAGIRAQRVVAEAEQDHRLVDRRVRVLAAVDADAGAGRRARPGPRARTSGTARLARGGERVQRRDRRRVVDHALERVGQAEQLPQPAERHLLELGRRRRGAPQHRLLVERGGQELGEDAGRAAGDGEVGEEAGMVPVRDAGQDDALEVGEDRVERLAVLGRARRERVGGSRRAVRAKGPDSGPGVRGSPLSSPRAGGLRRKSDPSRARLYCSRRSTVIVAGDESSSR